MAWRSADARIDIAVATERLKSQLRIFRVTEDGIADITSPGNTRVFADRSGEQAAPMGISLYRRPRDGAIFAIVSPKNGPRENYLAQYRLSTTAGPRESDVRPLLRRVQRRGGDRSRRGRRRARLCLLRRRERRHPQVPRRPRRTRTPLASSRISAGPASRRTRRASAFTRARTAPATSSAPTSSPGSSEYHVYRREGEPGRPHDHTASLKSCAAAPIRPTASRSRRRPLGPAVSRRGDGRDEQLGEELPGVPVGGRGGSRRA